tara:strand:+ start:1153 stop:1803 length:651 start_codon:yes stop_codon:yes gene_type:complete
MTIVSSGAISINSLVSEYGGSAPHSMSEYYRGGSLVANHSNNGNVPTSGTISLSNFYGQNNQSPVNLTCAGTLATFYPAINKYNAVRNGVTGNVGNLGSHVPYPSGTITDATFTNSGGTTTFTLSSFYSQTDTIFPNDSTANIRLVGNYSGSTFNAVTGYSNVVVNGISKPVGVNVVGSAVTGSYDAGSNTTVWNAFHTGSTTLWGGSGGFTMSFT